MSDQPNSSTRSKLTFFELVVPPISNQEAVHFKNEPFAEHMKKSDLYMIAGKTKSRFMNLSPDLDKAQISFDIYVGDDYKSSGSINIHQLDSIKDFEGSFSIGCGSDEIELFYECEGENLLLDRLTPESIVWRRSRNESGLVGMDNYSEVLVYDLLYVGIAKKGDSYERLIANGHHARQDILSNELQRYPGARVSEEIFIFLFRPEPLFVSSFNGGGEIDLNFEYDHKRIIVDAEKAFVSLLEPSYNSVRFKQYPKGADGLYDSKLDQYFYSIGEAITFNTPHGPIKGDRQLNVGFTGNADIIAVDKESAQLIITDELSWKEPSSDIPK